MLIQILGTGCVKCSKLALLAEEAAQKAETEYILEKVSDIDKILSFGVMSLPALVVNGKVKCSGSLPTIEQIIAMFE